MITIYRQEKLRCTLKCLAILGAKEAVISMNQMEALSDKMGVVELPFEVRA
jgi:hypothetical protein